jgi:molybdopterin-containing oxidoreductase family iron-sulfur binding subunit
VSKLKASDRNYQVLDYLFTRPRLTYLARVRNPNPKMPDYQEYTLTTQEYVKAMGVHGDPYAPHGAHGNGHATDAHAVEAGHGATATETKGAH